ncbi:hypothetical protein BVRB_3g053880 [Beta vulgaris subsp. vulgaris]|nr:hypothetical protein BVRB_3g053880 [Beta vulgaris subsp. vulgaris]
MPPLMNTNEVKNTSVALPTRSSGSSEGGFSSDEKKRRRMESNRESARRSRQKKQQHLDDLIREVSNLTRENEEIGKKIGEVSGIFDTIDAQNKVLVNHKDKLSARLESLESIIEIAKVVRSSSSSSGNNNNNNGECLYELNSDPMMKPWQLPCPSMPIFASSGVNCFKF